MEHAFSALPKNLGKMVETKVSTEFKTHIDVAVMEKIQVKLPINKQSEWLNTTLTNPNLQNSHSSLPLIVILFFTINEL